jgi:hypothetical protein
VELLVGEGDGPLKSHCVCPHEGSCLQKVKTRCGSGHGLIRQFVVSCVEVETSKVVSRGPDPLHPQSVRYFCLDYSALDCVQEREMEDSRRILCGFCSPGSLKDPRRQTWTCLRMGNDSGVKCSAGKTTKSSELRPGYYRTMARMRTGGSPGVLFFAGATMMSEPVAGSEVKRAVPSTT